LIRQHNPCICLTGFVFPDISNGKKQKTFHVRCAESLERLFGRGLYKLKFFDSRQLQVKISELTSVIDFESQRMAVFHDLFRLLMIDGWISAIKLRHNRANASLRLFNISHSVNFYPGRPHK